VQCCPHLSRDISIARVHVFRIRERESFYRQGGSFIKFSFSIFEFLHICLIAIKMNRRLKKSHQLCHCKMSQLNVGSVSFGNWLIDNLIVGLSTWRYVCERRELTFFITYKVIWANQKIASLVYRWLRSLVILHVTRFHAFVGASDVISSVMSIR